MIRRSGYILLLCLFVISSSRAQNLGFTTYLLEDGLPQSEVMAMIQDSRGSIWFGTNGGGLARFNGREFTTYTVDDGIPGDLILGLYEDSKGRLWIGSMDSYGYYDGYDFHRFSSVDSSRLTNYVGFIEDPSGNIWVVAVDEQNLVRIYHFDQGKGICLNEQVDRLINNPVLGHFYDPSGILYLTTQNGLYEYDFSSLVRSPLNDRLELSDGTIFPNHMGPSGLWILKIERDGNAHWYTWNGNQLTEPDLPDDPFWPGAYNVFEEEDGTLWFSNFGQGIARISGDKIHYLNKDMGFPSNAINGFMQDHEKNLWISTRGSGVINYAPNLFNALKFEDIINARVVRSLFQDSRGNYWFGVESAGLVRFGPDGFRTYEDPGIRNVRDIQEMPDGSLLIADNTGLYLYNGKVFIRAEERFNIQGNYIYSDILKDGEQYWIATFNYGVFRIQNGDTEVLNLANSKLESNTVTHIFKDSKGSIWLSTNNGVTCISGDSIRTYTVRDGLASNITIQVDEDQLGRKWIATYTGGITVFDHGEFTRLTTRDGLASNNIYSVIADPEGDIWIGTQFGADRVKLDDNGEIKEIRNYGKDEGFTGIECNGRANLMARDRTLWFGTIDGAMFYNPEEEIHNPVEPILNLTQIRLFFREVNWQDERYDKLRSSVEPWFPLPHDLVLPYDSNHISFDFEALCYQNPGKVKYQWILKGLDKSWSPLSDKTEASYPGLPPGKYTFMVSAMNNSGVWTGEPVRFSFEVKPPWYMAWWFFLIIGLVIITAIYLFFRIRLDRIKRKKEELQRMVDEKTREVVQQRDEIAGKNTQLEQQKEEIERQTETLQHSFETLEMLSAIGRSITSQITVESITDTVYEQVNKIMDATVFGIGVYNPDKQTIDFRGVKEKGQILDDLSFSLDDDTRLSVYCFNRNEEIVINDFDSEYQKYLSVKTPPGKTGNSSSIIYIPLNVKNEKIGVITVQSFKKNIYSEYHLNVLRNLAVYVKIALDNAAVYERLEEHRKNLLEANQSILKQKEQIEISNRELLELNQEKNYLISILAHDLRNPITSAISVAHNIYSDEKLPQKEIKQHVNFIINVLSRLDKMIAKILDLRSIEDKKIKLNCEKANLAELMKEVFNQLGEQADKKNIKVHLDVQEIYAIVDRHYTMQVFENLLSNAIKFSPPDKEVWVRTKEQNGEALVHFIDQGPGMSETDKKLVFKKYQKLSAKPTGGEHSTGLGLSIVKKYVEAMSGRVWFESEPGKGSEFVVSFQRVNK